MDKATVDTAHRAEPDGTDEGILPVRAMPAETAFAGLPPTTGNRRFGSLKGRVDIGPEFFDPLPEDELRAWE